MTNGADRHMKWGFAGVWILSRARMARFGIQGKNLMGPIRPRSTYGRICRRGADPKIKRKTGSRATN